MVTRAPQMLSYRPEIDGLRAVAVVSVILYHAQFVLFGNEWFQGGFIGVDIFFVISGYLISRIIFSELQSTGSFSFTTFYERRARRILPMLFVVIFASFPLAWNVLLPSAFIEYAESILASLFFGSNFFFYFSTTEYGADSSLLKPFLHTWSLGVEEQFYLLFPCVAILAFGYCRQYFQATLIILTLLSLGFAEFMHARNPDLNFYLPFSRFWELLAGSVLAYRELNFGARTDFIGKRLLPTIGLVLVGFGIWFFDGSKPHPGLITLLPVAGVALIIGFASTEELIGKFLGARFFVAVGLVSYSAYLWHFPVFAFARMGTKPDNFDKLSWILLTAILSVISYFLIEKPFRKRASLMPGSFLWIALGSFTVIASASVLVITNDGYIERFPKILGFENYQLDNQILKRQSWNFVEMRRQQNPNFSSAERKVLIVGNSHAKDFYNALVQNGYPNENTDVITFPTWQVRCADERIEEFAERRKSFYSSRLFIEATTILISTRYGEGGCIPLDKTSLPKARDVDGLGYLISRSVAAGKHVVVLGNTAETNKVNKMWVADFVYNQYKAEEDLRYKSAEILLEANELLWRQLRSGRKAINERVSSIAAEQGVHYFDKMSIVCDQTQQTCSAFTDEGYKTMYDYGHWTLEGAKYFGERVVAGGFDSLLR